jgi:hypothetical protein
MDVKHGHIAWIIIFVVILIIAILYTGFHFLSPLVHITSTISTSTTSILVNKTANNTTKGTSTTINYTDSELPCSQFYIIGEQFNTTYTTLCKSNGTTLGLWVASGYAGKEHVSITGADGRIYVNQTSTYNCTTFFQNFTGPAQIYTITYTTGLGGGSCGNSEVIINTTTTPPKATYDYIYNGNFGNGQYTGWNVSNPGFGTAPLNITYADSSMCYNGQPWTNYNGTYFATTYNCGVSVAPGNLTSAPFVVNPSKPFLNFRAISPENNEIYVEILKQNFGNSSGRQVYTNVTPVIIAHINTYNITVNINSSSTFQNVSIPLTQYINQVMLVRVVTEKERESNNYIAIGDFILANRPNEQRGVIVNISDVSS